MKLFLSLVWLIEGILCEKRMAEEILYVYLFCNSEMSMERLAARVAGLFFIFKL